MNRYKKKIQQPPENIISEYIIPFENDPCPYRSKIQTKPCYLDLKSIFRKNLPLLIEIGFGTGIFLLSLADLHPECNVMGIERVKKLVWLSAKKAFSMGLKNLKLVNSDASIFIKRGLCDKSVHKIYIYFPDPWHKKRHYKRRLLNKEFIDELKRILVKRGTLDIVTDHENYFNYILGELSFISGFERALVEDEFTAQTGYFIKSLKAGRKVHRLFLEKV